MRKINHVTMNCRPIPRFFFLLITRILERTQKYIDVKFVYSLLLFVCLFVLTHGDIGVNEAHTRQCNLLFEVNSIVLFCVMLPERSL